MNKPVSVVVEETKTKIKNICRESNLPPFVLDLILNGIYLELHSIAEKQVYEEEKIYIKALEENKEKETDSIDFN